MKSSADLRNTRKLRQRFKIAKTIDGRYRLLVHRTNSHIYAQIIDKNGKDIVVASSSLSKEIDIKNGGNKAAAELVGKDVAEKALKKNIKDVVFDRSGFLYHGRIKALADSARAAGLNF